MVRYGFTQYDIAEVRAIRGAEERHGRVGQCCDSVPSLHSVETRVGRM